MPNPLNTLVSKYFRPDMLPRVKRFAVGIAEDFWKDGTENPLQFAAFFSKTTSKRSLKSPATMPAHPQPNAGLNVDVRPKAVEQPSEGVSWHAAPGEISEKMWGEGFVTPGDQSITELLIQPLGLNKDLSVLDLSAGLGGRLRKTTQEFGVYVTGLEPDPLIAARGMELSIRAGKAKHAAISAYDPANFSVARRYDCIIARETFYRLSDRKKFFLDLANCTKPGGQLSFTDYIVNLEMRDKPALKSWMSFEKGANPPSLVEMAQEWAKAGFNLRVHDDQTEFYKREVVAGLKRLSTFLAGGIRPDPETKMALQRRVDTWVLRLAALEQGMKFYRFYGTKI